jgi:osmotically-inducible protein OsmY
MDSDLKRRIELCLQQKGVSSLPRLNIDVESGQVMLRGTVRSFYERQLCLCCQHVAGVLRVIDDLKVELEPTPQVSVTG